MLQLGPTADTIAMTRKALIIAVLISCFGFGLTEPARGQDGPAKQEEHRRKAAAVEKLKDELSRAQKELERLQKENEQLRREKSQAGPGAPAVAPKPSRPLVELPVIDEHAVVNARDLALYYEADPAAADQRFKNKRFRITGTVEGFNPKLFAQQYEVYLEAPDKQTKIACGFRYREDYTAVVTRRRGQELAARNERGGEGLLLKVGDVVTVQGRCKGLSEGAVELAGCEVVR